MIENNSPTTYLDLPRLVDLRDLRLGDEHHGRLEQGPDVWRGLKRQSGVGAELEEAELVEQFLAVASRRRGKSQIRAVG